jgi:transcriptional regulator with XRE-family HTH domain
METIGQKIVEIRKRKGLSQEALSDRAKINLRTLQRIEKDETEPLGNTLKNICNVLEINIEDILDYGKIEDNKYFLFFYLSVLSFFVIPLGNILVPMILWIIKRDKIIDLNKRGITLLKVQLIWTIVFYGSIITFGIIMTTNHLEHRFLFTPLIIIGFFILINISYVIIMCLKVSRNRIK